MDQLFSLGHVSGAPKGALTWQSDPLEPSSGEQITSMSRPKFLPENFTLALIATVVAASVLPCHGAAALAVDDLTNLAIALLFFLHGAKLSREAAVVRAVCLRTADHSYDSSAAKDYDRATDAHFRPDKHRGAIGKLLIVLNPWLSLNQRVPGSSPGAPTRQSIETGSRTSARQKAC
jgi:sodium/bile acid cotransporter family protein DUF4137